MSSFSKAISRLRRPYDGSDVTMEHEEDAFVAGVSAESMHQSFRFSYIDYAIFILLGVAMLWSWNMFLAAIEYFKYRMNDEPWLRDHVLAPSVTTTFTVTNFLFVLTLTWRHEAASYPKRISHSLTINSIVSAALMTSTMTLLGVNGKAYFGFLLAAVIVSGGASALIMNGLFAFMSGFPTAKYPQAVMAGQGIAGVLPSIVQIVTVLAATKPTSSQKGAVSKPSPAFWYFMAAIIVSSASIAAFLYLLSRHRHWCQDRARIARSNEADEADFKIKPIIFWRRTAWRLRWFGSAKFTTFVVTMFFPIFTQKISSVQTDPSNRLLLPDAFVPLGLLAWNIGDFVGRVLPLLRIFRIDRVPWAVLVAALLRLLFIPLYMSCNIDGRGARVQSDWFYLLVVQLPFGVTNGVISTVCMMAAPAQVEPRDREAAGSFMSLCVIGAMAVGSGLSFAVA